VKRSGKRDLLVRLTVVWVISAVCAFALSCGRAQDEPATEAPAVDSSGGSSEAGGLELIPVHVALPLKGEISSYIQSSTTVAAESEADVYSKAIGICKSVAVEEGDRVRAGDLLALLEDEDVQIAAQQAGLRHKKASEDSQRAEQMAAEELISAKAFEEAKFALELAEADLKLAKRRLENTRIRSPVDGVITERMLKPADLVATTSKLFKVVDLQSLTAVVHVPEREAGFVRTGQRVEVMADSLSAGSFSGRVKRISPVVDPRSGTVKVTIELGHAEGLKPGLFIRTRIVTDTHEGTLLIPKAAILLEGDEQKVFVVREGIAEEIFIRAGYSEAEKVEVLHGIGPEDQLVVLGHLGLKSGSRVKIVDRGGISD